MTSHGVQTAANPQALSTPRVRSGGLPSRKRCGRTLHSSSPPFASAARSPNRASVDIFWKRGKNQATTPKLDRTGHGSGTCVHYPTTIHACRSPAAKDVRKPCRTDRRTPTLNAHFDRKLADLHQTGGQATASPGRGHNIPPRLSAHQPSSGGVCCGCDTALSKPNTPLESYNHPLPPTPQTCCSGERRKFDTLSTRRGNGWVSAHRCRSAAEYYPIWAPNRPT